MTASLERADIGVEVAADPSPPPPAEGADPFIVAIDGYEGPLDLLLALAREQKVDLLQISIQALADQYLGFIRRAQFAEIEFAAEYLVMAAWLAYLKSRLMLPAADPAEAADGEEMAAALQARLAQLDVMQAAAAALRLRPRLGVHFFPRGAAAAQEPRPAPGPVRADLSGLIAAYAAVLKARAQRQPMTLEAGEWASIEQAIARIRRSLGDAPGWESLMRYLPAETMALVREGRLAGRSQLAATLSATLELAKEGVLALRQARPFGPIFVKALQQSQEPE